MNGWAPSLSKGLLVVCFGVIAAVHIGWGWASVTPFDGYPTNGAFQLYNTLRRMDSGQLPGRDFPVFHGLGIPLVHYPVYRLGGGDLFASEMARHLVSRVSAVMVYLLASWLFTRSLLPGLLWSVLSLSLDLLLPEHWWWIHELPRGFDCRPQNSSLGLRSLLPVLFVAVLYGCPQGKAATGLLGILLAMAWMLGVEQGIALVAGVSVTWLAFRIARSRRPAVIGSPSLAWVLGVGGLVWAGLVLLCARDKLVEVLRFYFVKLPGDQVWYFGVPPNNFLGDGTAVSLADAARIVAISVVCAAWWLRSMRYARHAIDATSLNPALANAVAASYAALSLASYLGMTKVPYCQAAYRILVVFGTVWLYKRAASAGLWKRLESEVEASRFAKLGMVTIGAVLALMTVSYLVRSWRQADSAVLSDEWQQVATRFSDIVRAECPEPATGQLWSTYASIVEDRLGILNPQVDFIIHALGDDRADYFKRFAEIRPPFVQTMRRDFFMYEEWLQATSWPFYEQLLLNYEVVAISEWSLLWRRTDRPWREPPADAGSWREIPIPAGAQDVEVPAGPADAQIAVVRVKYEVRNPLHRIPVLGQQGRFLVTAEDSRTEYAVSLPPRQTVHEFPVFVKPGAQFTLGFRVQGWSPGTRLRVVGVSVRYLSVPRVNSPFLSPPNGGR